LLRHRNNQRSGRRHAPPGAGRVQIWVPDVTAEGLAAKARRHSPAVAASEVAGGDQALVNLVSEWPAG